MVMRKIKEDGELKADLLLLRADFISDGVGHIANVCPTLESYFSALSNEGKVYSNFGQLGDY